MKKKTYTPMMNHYLEVKERNPDAILFYRLGDFYEMFFEDAKLVSYELDLVLTGRNAGADEKVPMCGIPHHAAKNYIQKLISRGYKVAIVEQLEDASQAKGLVKRDVIKIITPGTIMDDMVDEKYTSYIAAVYDFQYQVAVVMCDMMSGELQAIFTEKSLTTIKKLVLDYNIKEIIISEDFDKILVKEIKEESFVTLSTENNYEMKQSYQHLVKEIDDYRILKSFALLTNYLDSTQKRMITHLTALQIINDECYLKMDYNTKQNLELVQSLKSENKKNTLWNYLDRCKTAMGSRLMKKWVSYPLVNVNQINERLSVIEYLNANFLTKHELKQALSNVYDLERLIARIAYGSANPRDIIRLVKTLEQVPCIKNCMIECNTLKSFHTIDDCNDLYELLRDIFVSDPPLNIKEGNIFKEGYHIELDQLRQKGKSGKEWLLNFEAQEKEKTGIKSLKVGFNRVFGYFIEVTKSNVSMIKDEYGYIRKQTMANAERYITEELKKQEEDILYAKERSITLEIELFQEILKKVRKYMDKLHEMVVFLSNIDCLYALSEVASENGFVRPIFHSKNIIDIKEGRHPILEQHLNSGSQYVSNNFYMNEDTDVVLITGPNMGGKSTFMRQSAIIVIMAQIGSFVPARKAILPIFDQIFTRIGASDDIMSNQSTFMVEMMEANHALQNATKNSFVIFDEIGRGTATYDGMALAQAMIEYISYKIHCKTLFSTHYHELTDLTSNIPQIINSHVDVYEEDNKITFLYRMVDGKADKSYGINVARLAKIPEAILERASQILSTLEDSHMCKEIKEAVNEKDNVKNTSTNLCEVEECILNIDENKLTPIEALLILQDIKKKVLDKKNK